MSPLGCHRGVPTATMNSAGRFHRAIHSTASASQQHRGPKTCPHPRRADLRRFRPGRFKPDSAERAVNCHLFRCPWATCCQRFLSTATQPNRPFSRRTLSAEKCPRRNSEGLEPLRAFQRDRRDNRRDYSAIRGIPTRLVLPGTLRQLAGIFKRKRHERPSAAIRPNWEPSLPGLMFSAPPRFRSVIKIRPFGSAETPRAGFSKDEALGRPKRERASPGLRD